MSFVWLLVWERQTPHSKGLGTLIPSMTFKNSKNWSLTPFDPEKEVKFKVASMGTADPLFESILDTDFGYDLKKFQKLKCDPV